MTNVLDPDKSTPNVEKEIDNTSNDINDEEQLNEEDMVVDMEKKASNKGESIVNTQSKTGLVEIFENIVVILLHSQYSIPEEPLYECLMVAY